MIIEHGDRRGGKGNSDPNGRGESASTIPTHPDDPWGTLLVSTPWRGQGRRGTTSKARELWKVAAQSPWQAVRLLNGNTLIAGDDNRYAREVNPDGSTVVGIHRIGCTPDTPAWETSRSASRLAGTATAVLCMWIAGEKDTARWPGTVQVLEVTHAKSIVWALSSWDDPDLGPATSIQLLDDPRPIEHQER